jgi:signal transduction histidine kinase
VLLVNLKTNIQQDFCEFKELQKEVNPLMFLFNFAFMLIVNKKGRPLFWFYILVTYVLLQFVWWGYLMINLNNEQVLLKNEINLLKGESPEEIISKGNELNEKLHKRWLMITGEGVVFISLLVAGIYQVRKTFKKEEELNQRQNNFLLSVTHELKSPIASAKLQLQTLVKHDLARDKQLEIILNAINDTERLNNLVENILMAAKIENKVFRLHKDSSNVSEYLTEIINNTIQSFNYKQKIEIKIDPNIELEIDKMSFPSIMLNLLENAVKYSPENSIIKVHLTKQNNCVKLSVSDQGIGIPDDEKKSVFKKFYRIGSEETRKTKGTGLGLYIVNYIVQQHNGAITVKDNLPKGSIFEVEFSISS